MVKSSEKIESKPSLAALNQIQVPKTNSEVSKNTLKQLTKTIEEQGTNYALPIVCLTDKEDIYQLLTGLPIYEAAVAANLERIWVFLVAAQKNEAEKFLNKILSQSKLNELIVDTQDVNNFIKLLDKGEASILISIPGIKEKSAKLIIDNRPYQSLEDLKKLGAKRYLNWLRAYKTSTSDEGFSKKR
jgi:DNA uptake protein ComE-like DNA-binding protein